MYMCRYLKINKMLQTSTPPKAGMGEVWDGDSLSSLPFLNLMLKHSTPDENQISRLQSDAKFEERDPNIAPFEMAGCKEGGIRQVRVLAIIMKSRNSVIQHLSTFIEEGIDGVHAFRDGVLLFHRGAEMHEVGIEFWVHNLQDGVDAVRNKLKALEELTSF